ncbi:hypothetical protein M433DRAFT_158176, partial [Acidomyces richmondensis BFW]
MVAKAVRLSSARTASWIIHLAAAVRPLLELARSFQFDVPASLKSLSLTSYLSRQKIRMSSL